MQSGFTFDINKCVGCHACFIACSVENDLGFEDNWRQLITYNPNRIENISHYHLSLACNHCEQAICITQCPAKTISKNEQNGIVHLDEKKCIGCRYCNWVCPYDAPQFSHSKKVMTKCTLCSHKLEENYKPACVSICPTDALGYDQLDSAIQNVDIPGFPPSEMKPSIFITAVNPELSVPEKVELPYSREIINSYFKNKPPVLSKISLNKEWTLVLFTLFIAVLGGVFSTAVFSNHFINPFVFAIVGLLGMGLSTIHLGKKTRAYRALFNWRKSWLSREILLVFSFLLFSTLFLFFVQYKTLGYVSLILVIAATLAMDKVYLVTAQTKKEIFHSSQIWLSLLFFSALFNQYLPVIILFASIKLALYLIREIKTRRNEMSNITITILRVAGLIIGITILFSDFTGWFSTAVILILFSELLDRIEFYTELDIITPEKHMEKHFNQTIKQSTYANG